MSQWAESISVGNDGRANLTSDPAAGLGEVLCGVSTGFSTGTAAVSAAGLEDLAILLTGGGESAVPARLATMFPKT